MTIELVTYADLKALMDLGDSAITDYPALDTLRDSVTGAFESYTGRLFDPIARTVTQYVNNFSLYMISLPGLPITSVSSVVVTTGGDSETYTEDSDFEITGYGLRLFSGVQNCKIVITYTGGLSAVPTDLNRAALLQTSYEFQGKDNIGAESVSTEGGSVSRPALGLLSTVKEILNNYKHPLRW